MKKLLSKSFWKNNLFLSKHKKYIGKNFSQSITMGNTVIEFDEELNIDVNLIEENFKKNYEKVSPNLIEEEINSNAENFSKTHELNEGTDEMKNTNDPLNLNFQKTSFFLEKHYFSLDLDKEQGKFMERIFEFNFHEMKTAKRFEELDLFVRNCKTFGLEDHLKDEKNFLDAASRHFILNTCQLESIYRMESEDSLFNQQNDKFKRIRYEKASAIENKEEYDHKMNQKHNQMKTEIMNDFAESRIGNKITQMKEIRFNNKKVIEDYFETSNVSKEENELAKDLALFYGKQLGKYIQKTVQKKQRQDSFNLSMAEEKLKKEEQEEFLSVLSAELDMNEIKVYPGSIKGPAPEDDPQFYLFWHRNNEPKVLKDLREKAEKEGIDLNDFHSGTSEMFDNVKIKTDRITCNKSTYLLNGGLGERPYDDMDHYNEKEILDGRYLDGKPLVFMTLKDPDEIDVLPPKLSVHYLDNIEEVAKWSYFQFIPRYKSFMKGLFDFPAETYSKTLENFRPKKQQTLLSYYYLLPKWARDHPIIKMVVQNLEHTKAHSSYREKQLMVNLACSLIMPINKEIGDVLIEGYTSKKRLMTDENKSAWLAYEYDEYEIKNTFPDEMGSTSEDEGPTMTVAQIRREEREMEEEAKQKKKEEGRKKREAEQAAEAKKAEEKKKKKKGKGGDEDNKPEKKAEPKKEEQKEEEEEEEEEEEQGKAEEDEEDKLDEKSKKNKRKGDDDEEEDGEDEDDEEDEDREEGEKKKGESDDEKDPFLEYIQKDESDSEIEGENNHEDEIENLNGDNTSGTQNKKEELLAKQEIDEFSLNDEDKQDRKDLENLMSQDVDDSIHKILAKKRIAQVTNTEYEVEDERSVFSTAQEDQEKMTDVYIKPQPDPYAPGIDIEPNLPIDYYINDDGFWDDYIKEKYHDSVDIKQLMYKPLIQYSKRIDKKKQNIIRQSSETIKNNENA